MGGKAPSRTIRVFLLIRGSGHPEHYT